MVVPCDEKEIVQVSAQLDKLIHVREVNDVTVKPCVERELMLVKVNANAAQRSEVMQLVQVFRARIVDIAENAVTVQVVGDPGKMVAILQMLEKFGIIEVARTGKLALVRESGVNTEYLKSAGRKA
jgi:acetolactate synthase-1/3 small subunit